MESGNTKERLFHSALSVFAEKGYRGATVRDICRRAGAANINSINYYFGGKEKLYRNILEFMYSEFSRRKPDYPDHIPPEMHLREYIASYCEMTYMANDLSAEFKAIAIAELTNPSKWMKPLVKKHMRQQTLEIMKVIRKILGPSVPEDVLRNSVISIGGQIMYYAFAWPLVSVVFPDHPGMDNYYNVLADHIYEFSMAGLMAIKDKYENKE